MCVCVCVYTYVHKQNTTNNLFSHLVKQEEILQVNKKMKDKGLYCLNMYFDNNDNKDKSYGVYCQ